MITEDQFQQKVIAYQQQHGRHDLPWQVPASPYRVLVSEIMLQQTQVKTVIPYFNRWMESFPTIQALADASEEQVMAHWQGLGYYRRARNLKKAAQYIAEELNGEFPRELEDIQSIPGVGRYTAGAIRSFAFNQWGPIVDGNVRRLFTRLFAIEGVPTQSKVDKQLWDISERLTPTENNRVFAQGLLDIGAEVCKPKNPQCTNCPFSSDCEARLTGRELELPTKKPKKTAPVREYHFVCQLEQDQLVLEKRPPTGIWSSLWMLPQLERAPQELECKFEFEHTFTHFKMKGKVWYGSIPETNSHEVQEATRKGFKEEHVEQLGIPAPLKKHFQAIMSVLKS
ncbi:MULTISPECIES: A/G-specific adenine glycosylase [Gammaproteobacteria]|uniref:A/G-specific adenine glycosylase n=1 Tax=Gammaproteobacteria TaxID=1236 RepID=UPI000DCFFC70|nr:MULTISPECIES: A/G-specific adenine glycosylase [Gammaproteobacteria]RTE87716.1 A/G-specific adenine glycosylase [Aliidiomarina sp. B3213]TCZ92501.1 A/G-specific adenine glycosylase [Lysobacter sp. N42]